MGVGWKVRRRIRSARVKQMRWRYHHQRLTDGVDQASEGSRRAERHGSCRLTTSPTRSSPHMETVPRMARMRLLPDKNGEVPHGRASAIRMLYEAAALVPGI